MRPAFFLHPNPVPLKTNPLSTIAPPISARPIILQPQMSFNKYISEFRFHVPPLDQTSHKGQAGRIAVIGGSEEYTGAPYFSAIAAMRAGAELSFVFCPTEAAASIKAYSPDLIVYPGYHLLGNQCEALSRMHTIVIGPGMGRHVHSLAVFEKVLDYAIGSLKLLVIDADALWFLSQNIGLLARIGAAPEKFHTFLTPNKIELARLLDAGSFKGEKHLLECLNGRATIIAKGKVDRIISRTVQSFVDEEASMKRVGGQGDILSGILATFAFWMCRDISFNDAKQQHEIQQLERATVTAGVAACALTRFATLNGFRRHGRSFVASDALSFIGDGMNILLGNEND